MGGVVGAGDGSWTGGTGSTIGVCIGSDCGCGCGVGIEFGIGGAGGTGDDAGACV